MSPYRLVTALALAAPLLAPASADATMLARASAYETPPRKGFYAEIALRPGAVVLRDGLVPVLRHHFSFGAGLTDRFKLGLNLHIGGYLDNLIKKPVLGSDVVATAYVWRGMYLRAGFGVVADKVQKNLFASRQVFTGSGRVGIGQSGERHRVQRVPATEVVP